MTAAWVFAVLCAGVAGFHLAVVLGAPLGPLTQGGRHKGALPLRNRIFAAISAVVTGFMALAVLAAAGQGPGALAHWPAWWGWSAVVFAALAVVANLATPSRPERLLWAPVSAVLLVSSLRVMLSAPLIG